MEGPDKTKVDNLDPKAPREVSTFPADYNDDHEVNAGITFLGKFPVPMAAQIIWVGSVFKVTLACLQFVLWLICLLIAFAGSTPAGLAAYLPIGDMMGGD
jgi:hypothetical protein